MIRRTALVLAALGLTMCAAPALAGGSAVEQTGVVPAAARALLEGRCLTSAPDTAAGWQRAFDDFDDARWSGADQASSVRLPDGRLLWLFGDTFQGNEQPDGSRAENSQFVRNTFVLADGGCLKGVTGPTGAEIIPNTPGGQWFWPQHAFLDQDRLLVTVLRVTENLSGMGTDAFRLTGTQIAEFSGLPGQAPQFLRLHATPSEQAVETDVLWGTAVAQHDGWTYLYGTRRDAAPGTFGKALHVARAPAGRATDLTAWTYWDGTAWSPTAPSAATIHPARGGVSTSLSVWYDQDSRTWQAFTKKDEFLGDQVIRLTAPHPAGPWTETTVGSSPSGRVPGELTYTALAHPHIPLANGSLLTSISRNHTDLAVLMSDADLYKPQFTAVPR